MQTEITVRDQIVRTASRLFLTQGYNLTGINQIIEEAGVAKASLYYHFPSKEDLGVAYLLERARTWFSGLDKHLGGLNDPRERLIRVFEYRATFVVRNKYSGCSHIRIISELPQRGTKIHNQATEIKEQQRGYFRQLVEQIPEVPGNRVDDLANTIFLLFDGATMQSQVYGNTEPLKMARKAVADLLEAYPAAVAIA